MSPLRKINKLVILISIVFTMSSCHFVRYFYWNYAGIDDGKKFPAFTIENQNKVFDFKHSSKNIELIIPEKFISDEENIKFDSFLETHETIAFLVIKDDTILYEKYFSDIDEKSLLISFSVAKSFISALIGIAIDEGFIINVHQPITDFLPKLKEKDVRFSNITIDHLLNMRSGIKFSEEYNSPFALMAKFYYGTNLKKYVYNLKIEKAPDLEYKYQSANTQILSMIIEEATGKQFYKYFEEKLWKPLQTKSIAKWNYDSEKNKTIKAFCCLNATARDFAKFGRLYLNKGKFNDNQIISKDWVNSSTTIMNDSRDSQNYPYTYYWRVKEDGAFFAKGILGQYIYVYPEKNLIFLRFGKSYGDIDWAEFFEKIGSQF
ncbi:MAG: beta-lactamase family protein [Bacteroidales bacterium]|nr:beta-lactamase family protein [Bacteroidales bacterium]